MSDWRQEHADAAELAAQHSIVDKVLDEFATNMGFSRVGLPEMGLRKIVSAVAQVVRARDLGFDPDLLRLRPDEANEALLARARACVAAGVPTTRIDPDGTVTRLD